MAYNIFFAGGELLGEYSKQYILLTGGAIAAIVGVYNKVSFKVMFIEIKESLKSVLVPILILMLVGALAGTLIPVQEQLILSFAVGLTGGTFLYISTSDLLPLAHESSQDYWVPIAFLVGFLGILTASFLNGV
ncbi:hypothetical protein IH922_05940 [candidate division KSB1 bacterium]|nr:hypothetical protein [candidate division KSB1 bacterium]